MNAAEIVIEKFGGQSALGRFIGKGQTTVQHWAKKGIIPAKWQSELLRLAKEHGINLTPSDFIENSIIASEDVAAIPKATYWGELSIGEATLPCYVLETGDRVFSLKGVVVGLIETDGGQLAEYIKVKNIKPYLSNELTPAENDAIPALIKFDTGGTGFTKHALGLPVEKFMDLCVAYSTAGEKENLTDKQKQISAKANSFLRACAKVGIVALVDEVTGYQYERAKDALQFKLKVFLEDEMRPWEKTFPDELWMEFGRLTHWAGPVTSRPKWWGKLVNELIYEYLDADVAKWLRENAPQPRGGMSYHRWLSSQYGLKKLIEHIWMVIGMSKACFNIEELRERMATQFGRQRVQLSFFVPPPTKKPDNNR